MRDDQVETSLRGFGADADRLWPVRMTTGVFITFEGIDGAGKSTQVARLRERLLSLGLDPLVTREPGGTALGAELRALLLGRPMVMTTELLLVAADRAEHLESVIWPALETGHIVISDRHMDSTWSYQVAAGADRDTVAQIEALVTKSRRPDRTILLDVAVGHRGGSASDRIEQRGVAYAQRVRELYLERALEQPERFAVLDGQRSQEAIAEDVWHSILPVLRQGRFDV